MTLAQEFPVLLIAKDLEDLPKKYCYIITTFLYFFWIMCNG